jgi:uncharacterized protein (DUF2237 family)
LDFKPTAVAAILTDPFLDFTASRGNNLRSIGLTAGCKWCLCASRWKEAFLYAKSEEGRGKEGIVPKVFIYSVDSQLLRCWLIKGIGEEDDQRNTT